MTCGAGPRKAQKARNRVDAWENLVVGGKFFDREIYERLCAWVDGFFNQGKAGDTRNLIDG